MRRPRVCGKARYLAGGAQNSMAQQPHLLQWGGAAIRHWRCAVPQGCAHSLTPLLFLLVLSPQDIFADMSEFFDDMGIDPLMFFMMSGLFGGRGRAGGPPFGRGMGMGMGPMGPFVFMGGGGPRAAMYYAGARSVQHAGWRGAAGADACSAQQWHGGRAAGAATQGQQAAQQRKWLRARLSWGMVLWHCLQWPGCVLQRWQRAPGLAHSGGLCFCMPYCRPAAAWLGVAVAGVTSMAAAACCRAAHSAAATQVPCMPLAACTCRR